MMKKVKQGIFNLILLESHVLTWDPACAAAVSLEGDDVAFVVTPSALKRNKQCQ